MTERTVRTVAGGFSYLECPRWHDGRVWVSDFYSHRVVAVADDGSVEDMATVPGQPSGLGWLPDGDLLIVSMKDRKILRRRRSGELSEHADCSGIVGYHLNDMVVSATGVAYLGNFGYDLMGGESHKPTVLLAVDPEGAVRVVADDLDFPNGAVITPDDKTLILDESMGNRISAFEILADGSLGPRSDWANWGPLPKTDDVAARLGAATVCPDGNTLDAEGAVWAADATHHRVVRVAKGGEILEEIGTGERNDVFACCLGGPDGRTLYLCLSPSFLEHERVNASDATLGAVEVDVPHAGLP